MEEVKGDGKSLSKRALDKHAPERLCDIDPGIQKRIYLGNSELDRVLGGGLVPSSVVLLAGEPGIGKSTLLLQFLSYLASNGKKVLYVSGEESAGQVRIRASRLGDIPSDLWIVSENQVEFIEDVVKKELPDVLAIDSIQTVCVQEIASAPGSVGQVRESAARLVQLAKSNGLPVILVGHVTKGGEIAGPRILEHMVDTVLYFEGDQSHVFRILRTVKNRFGPTHEIGVFEMTDSGLKEVPNPSEILMGSRDRDIVGSVVVSCIQGTRPILLEIQALVSTSHLTMPRRTATGFDSNRLAMLLAVAERHLGLMFYDADVFINVVGGLKIQGPEADLAVLSAMISSLRDLPIPSGTVVLGEVGLTGEVRALSRVQLRVNEAGRLGLSRCIIPAVGTRGLSAPKGLELLPVKNISDMVDVLFP